MAADQGYAWCPHCQCWVPAEDMNYDKDDDGRLLRVCSYCLGDKELPYNPPLKRVGFVHDPHHEQTQCIYCDSWNTVEQAPSWGKYKCTDCGETFRRLLE